MLTLMLTSRETSKLTDDKYKAQYGFVVSIGSCCFQGLLADNRVGLRARWSRSSTLHA